MGQLKAVGRAYVAFAADHPAIFRVMFGECGAASLDSDGGDPQPDSPWGLLGASLDALVADGILSPDARPGAEMKAWSVVHGFASLALDGAPMVLAGPEREAALEALLEFAVVGICGGKRG